MSAHRSKRFPKMSSSNVTELPSPLEKDARFSRKKSKYVYSRKMSTESNRPGNSKAGTRNESSSTIPKDAAVHFGNFYGLRESSTKNPYGDRKIDDGTTKSSRKSAFTRQMVNKLERTAGTKHYADQVSALLEETVEPANFRVIPPPPESSIPEGRQNPTGYPLWYKDFGKMPSTSRTEYKLMEEGYRRKGELDSKETLDIFNDEASNSEEKDDDLDRLVHDESDENETDGSPRWEEKLEFVEKKSSKCSSSVSEISRVTGSTNERDDDDDDEESLDSTEDEEDKDKDYETSKVTVRVH